MNSEIQSTPHPTPDSEVWRIIQESIASLPNSSPMKNRAQAAANQLEVSAQRRTKILGLVQEALSQLRLDTKYLIFDLEATCRERDSWKSKAEGK